jgi:hypothetical protein
MKIEPTVADEFLDIDPAFREVARKYGREMFALVMNAGVSQQAASVLAGLVEKHRSQHGLHAIGVLTQSFNQLSNQYVKKMGWTGEELVQCDRGIQMAFKSKLIVPGESGILLSH